MILIHVLGQWGKTKYENKQAKHSHTKNILYTIYINISLMIQHDDI